MTMSNLPQDTASADQELPPQTEPPAKFASGNGHPIRRQGLTFVTHEVEAKGPFGLPHWNTILGRAGNKKKGESS